MKKAKINSNDFAKRMGAYSHGYKIEIGDTILVFTTGPNCHICKQLIYESSLRSKIDTVVLIKEKSQIKQIPISKLMPYPWPEKPFV